MLLWASIALSALAAIVSLYCAFRPPQGRVLSDLRQRVEDLEYDVNPPDPGLHARLTKRARRENMDAARAAHEEKRTRREAIEQQAHAIISGATTSPVPAPDPDAQRAALRARVLFNTPPTGKPS